MPDETERFSIHKTAAATEEVGFAEDVRAGLTARPKNLPPKYFYDALGSQLFEAICLLPEYYLTRAEAEIFERHSTEITDQMPGPLSIVELGSGSSVKTRYLIEATLARQSELQYQPVDISATILEHSAQALLGEYPGLRIIGQVTDYTRSFTIAERRDDVNVLVLFLGSNVGNYAPHDAKNLLRIIRQALRPGDRLLLGADLKKSPDILEPAYDDPLGVTAAFNLNLLARINRELGGDFVIDRFAHRAFYNEDLGRMEIHIVSRLTQKVDINALGLQVEFAKGETIHTENSYKYDLAQLKLLAEQTGFRHERSWMDSQQKFSCNFWVAD